MPSSKIKLEKCPHWYNLERLHDIPNRTTFVGQNLVQKSVPKCSSNLDPKWTIRSWSSIQEQTISKIHDHSSNCRFGPLSKCLFWFRIRSKTGPEIGPLCYVESLSYLWQYFAQQYIDLYPWCSLYCIVTTTIETHPTVAKIKNEYLYFFFVLFPLTSNKSIHQWFFIFRMLLLFMVLPSNKFTLAQKMYRFRDMGRRR